MSSEEFFNIVKDYELKLEADRNKLYAARSTMRPEEFQFRVGVLEAKIINLKKLFDLPCYIKYRNCTDAEIASYISRVSAQAAAEIRVKEAEINTLKAELRNCDRQITYLTQKMAVVSPTDANVISINIQQLIARKTVLSGYSGEIAAKEAELAKMQQRKSVIDRTTPQQYRAKKLSRFASERSLFETYLGNPTSDNYTQLLAVIASNYSLFEQVTKIRKDFKAKQQEKKDLVVKFGESKIDRNLPAAGKEALLASPGFDKDKGVITSSSAIGGTFASLEADMTAEKNRFMTVMNGADLRELCGKSVRKRERMNTMLNVKDLVQVDLSILEKHKAILPDGELDLLKADIGCRQVTLNKILKSGRDREHILRLDFDIDQRACKLFKTIQTWYLNQAFAKIGIPNIAQVLGLTGDIEKQFFANPGDLARYVTQLEAKIREAERAFSITKAAVKADIQNTRNRSNAINGEINNLVTTLQGMFGTSVDVATIQQLLQASEINVQKAASDVLGTAMSNNLVSTERSVSL